MEGGEAVDDFVWGGGEAGRTAGWKLAEAGRPSPVVGGALRVLVACFLAVVVASSLRADEPMSASSSARTAEAEPPATSGPPPAPEWRTLGLMRIRDMTPFGLGRLDMLPAHAVAATPRTFAFEANASYQNTWALSDSVRDYLEARGVRRGPLDADAVADLLALPGDAYLVDGEFAVVDLTLHYRATRHLGLYATLPWFNFDGGFLDGVIESFHEQAGFSSAGREYVPRDRFFALADLSQTRVIVDQPPSAGPGDPVVGVRYSLVGRPRRFNLVLESAVKVSLVERKNFVATGRDDFGLQVSLQRFLRHNAFYLTAAGVYYGTPFPGIASDGWIPTVIGGWETKLTRNTNFILQAYASRSNVLRTDLDELTATKIQATIGLQREFRGYVLRFGATENLANYDNTPDVGFNVSVARIVFGR